MKIVKLDLSNFRSYADLRLLSLADFNIFYGANGAGKTNILESISFLTSGRGMRASNLREVGKLEGGKNLSWAVNAKIDQRGITEIGTGCIFTGDEMRDKRIVRINGKLAKTQSELDQVFNVVWLTPQMDRIFLEGAAGRRRFLDRLVASFDKGHSERLNAYSNAWKSRSEIIKKGMIDPVWLSGLEKVTAEMALAIAASRLEYVAKLNAIVEKRKSKLPKNIMSVGGWLEDKLAAGEKASLLEDEYVHYLEKNRSPEFMGVGVQHSDMDMFNLEKNMPSALCSTGEQKAMLISAVLAHSEMVKLNFDFAPVLLLDEIAAHLDAEKLKLMIDEIISLGSQVFITGVDKEDYSIIKSALFFKVAESKIQKK